MSRNDRTARESANKTLRRMYDRLWSAYGPQHWWPADTPTEVVIGAILTQNTAWRNVERAIANLKRANCLTWAAIRRTSLTRLAALIQPSGTYRVKAARLKTFVKHLWDHHNGSLASLCDGDLDEARRRLLAINGIGPETADAILLYAGKRPTFVVDAYTRRILRRHFVTDSRADDVASGAPAGRRGYESVRRLFHETFSPQTTKTVRLYNEYHALLVAVGKRHCRTRAQCEGCPLADLPHDSTL